MKFGIRKPSIKKSISSRTSVKRYIRHNIGIKVPRGYGIFSNPKKAIYNRIYGKTSTSLKDILIASPLNFLRHHNITSGHTHLTTIVKNYFFPILLTITSIIFIVIGIIQL